MKHYTRNRKQRTCYGIDETNQKLHAEDLNQFHCIRGHEVLQSIYGNYFFVIHSFILLVLLIFVNKTQWMAKIFITY